VIRKLPAGTNGTVEYKMNQVVGYLIGKSASSVNVYEELKVTVVKIGLNINIKNQSCITDMYTE
jgi:hypothetical protein